MKKVRRTIVALLLSATMGSAPILVAAAAAYKALGPKVKATTDEATKPVQPKPKD